MIRCGSSTEVLIVSNGEKVPVLCRLDDSHTCDHEGRFDGGMLLHWPRLPTVPLVIRLNEELTPFTVLETRATNAACVIGVSDEPYVAPRIMVGSDQWSSKPSNPIDDIKVAAEQMRRARAIGEVCPVCGASPGSNCLFGTWRLGDAMHVFQVTPKRFPIQDAGPHPKDEE